MSYEGLAFRDCSVATSGPLAPADLLYTAGALANLLDQAIRDTDWLDAYLLTAGLNQMVEDHLHPDPLQLYRVADFLCERRSTAARFAGTLSRRAASTLHRSAVGRSAGTLWHLHDLLTAASIELGRAVLDHANAEPRLPNGFDAALSTARVLGPDVLRVPSCFRSFDQHPDDIVELVRRFLDDSEHSAPVCVIGVRTSGSYLAPLFAAALKATGVTAVSVLTYRPGRPWQTREAKTVRNVMAAGGTFLVTDDPPVSGTALSRVGRAIEDLGVPAGAIVLLLALTGAGAPPTLDRWGKVCLPWQEWNVHDRITEAAVAEAMTGLLGPGHAVVARNRPWAQTDRRGHVRARFSVKITSSGGVVRRQIVVEGAGLGYLGRHAMAVAAALPAHCPRVYGFVDGMLYRDWTSGTPSPHCEPELAQAVTSYVVDRSHALRVASDPTLLLRGRQPAWEVAAMLLSPLFGRLGPVGQTALLERITQNLTRVDTASVTDGQTHVRHWQSTGPTGPLRKANFHQQSFSNLELTCYDPVFDLAGAAADPPSDDFERTLRHEYEQRTGVRIDHERWLLYRLAQLWRLDRTRELSRDQFRDRSADAVHDYLSAVFADLGSTHGRIGGPLCAIDLDGVLETDPLGYPCTTPTGALTLRSLSAHGYRPVLVTGRSLADTIARCRRFNLAGAVAEYGAALYDHRTGHSTDLRNSAAVENMEQVRKLLGEHGEIEVDERYRYVVRARSRHGPLPEDLTSQVASVTKYSVRVISGEGQSDFVPVGIDKGTGLRELVGRIAGPVALAVGDSTEDLAMLAEAEITRAPRNANAAVRAAGIPVTRGAYQSGLEEACADLLGHRPGACARCQRPEMPSRTAVLCAVLELRADGMRGLASRAAHLTMLLARTSRW